MIRVVKNNDAVLASGLTNQLHGIFYRFGARVKQGGLFLEVSRHVLV